MRFCYLICSLLLILNTGNVFAQEHQPCLSKEQRTQMKNEVRENIKDLKARGKLTAFSDGTVELDWPLRQADGFNFPNYYATINYVDQDPSSGIADYNCGTRTYNGHKGTDIMLWPYRWDMLLANQVEVIAGYSGTILLKWDGNFDQNCNCTSNNWNGIVIAHEDGSVAIYGHLRKNSLTNKLVGESVGKGEYLGTVGSSGCSTDPHLHFEMYADEDLNILVDPYKGACNVASGDSISWWQDQKPYRESRINRLMTHYAKPIQNWDCPANNDFSYESNVFAPGDTLYFSANYQDKLTGHLSDVKIYAPDNATMFSSTYTSTTTFNASWQTWDYILSDISEEGLWKFEVIYEGVTYTHLFEVKNEVTATNNPASKLFDIAPNPFLNELQVRFSNLSLSNDTEVQVFNAGMNELYQAKNINENYLLIPTEDFPAGIYFLRFRNGSKEHIEKLVKIK